METLPSGTVTFLFTDIEASTRLWEEHPEEMRMALARHDEVVRKAVDAFDGFVFSAAGDGFAAAFRRAGDGVGAAVAAQRALSGEPWPDSVVLRVRMGLHTGEAEERDGSYFGSAVNRAARLMASTQGGQVVVSSLTAALAGRVPGVELVELGAVRLRGLADPTQVFGVRGDGLEPVVRVSNASEATAGNLPYPVTEWFGPIAAVHRALASLAQRRLVTFTGPGGVGKTRLAVEAAWLGIDEFPDGVWFIDLAPIGDPAVVVAAAASTLSVRAQDGMTIVESVVDWLRGRRLLLIVDNCEHVMGPASELIGAVVAGAPTVTVLATSREPLGLSGERVVPVPSLVVSDAVALFCDRAVAAEESLEFTPTDRGVIGEICVRLDGIPLAIELAAARTRSLSVADILARLDGRFRLLRGSGRGGLDRHQTLLATVAWSYELLSEHERLLFDRISVFAGSFDLAAVESIFAVADIDADDPVDLLGSLVDKSMLATDRSAGILRYRLLETLRQYGEERLDHRDETAVMRDRHLDHYLGVAERAQPLVISPRQVEGQAIFDREWDNLRAALLCTIAAGDRTRAERLVLATYSHAFVRLRLEHRGWVDTVLELESADWHPSVATFGMAAMWALMCDDLGRSIAVAEDGIGRASSPDDPDTTECWSSVAFSHMFSGRMPEALAALTSGEAAAAANDDPLRRYWFLNADALWGSFAVPDTATESIRRAVDYADRVGAPSLMASAAHLLGLAAWLSEDPDEFATVLVRDGLALARQVDDRGVGGDLMSLIAELQAFRLSSETTADCWEALTHLYDIRYWLPVWPTLEAAAFYWAATGSIEAAAVVLGGVDAHESILTGLSSKMRDDTRSTVTLHPDANGWMARGKAMTRDAMVAFALEQLQLSTERA